MGGRNSGNREWRVIARALARSNLVYFMNKYYYVYLMSNERNTVLYAGVTNDLKKRVFEHKNKLCSGFTSKYNVTNLIYYEMFQDINCAIEREKQIKAGSRKKKIELINFANKSWKDLYSEI